MTTLKGTQHKIFEFITSKKGDLRGLSLREIGEEAGIGKRPQIVAHHLSQLERRGYLRRASKKDLIFTVLKNPVEGVVSIRRFQFAQCGPEGLLGDDSVVGEVPLPSQPFGITKPEDYFLIDTKGASMRPMIEEGDLVLAKIVSGTSELNNRDVVVLVHNEMPKIKRLLIRDTAKGRFYELESENENKEEYPTEFIDPDVEDFRVVGKVKSIIKHYE